MTCCTWVHANCDRVSKEPLQQCLVFYCELNHCYNHIKQLAAIHVKSSYTSDDANASIYQELIEIQSSSDLTSKIQSLSDQTAQLESYSTT